MESQPVLHPICLNRFFWFICDCIIFFSLYFILLFKQKKYPAYQYKWPAIVMNFILSLCLFMVTILFASIGSNSGRYKFQFIYSILYKSCIFKVYRLLNVQTLCIFPCFCPYEPKQGKFFILRRLPYPAVLRKYASLPL